MRERPPSKWCQYDDVGNNGRIGIGSLVVALAGNNVTKVAALLAACMLARTVPVKAASFRDSILNSSFFLYFYPFTIFEKKYLLCNRETSPSPFLGRKPE